MRSAGGGTLASYATARDGRRVLVVSPGFRVDAHLLDVAQIVPPQVPRRHPASHPGVRLLLLRMLVLAVVDAGWELDRQSGWHSVLPRQRARWRTHRTLAQRWLLGELDDQVAVPITWLCDVLGLDAAALAAAVRRNEGTNGQRHERTTTTNAARDASTDVTDVGVRSPRSTTGPRRRHAPATAHVAGRPACRNSTVPR
jgi:hypothetical protein